MSEHCKNMTSPGGFQRHMMKSLLILAIFIATVPSTLLAQNFRSCALEEQGKLIEVLQARAQSAFKTAHEEFDYEIATINAWRDVRLTEIIAEEANVAGEQFGPDFGLIGLQRRLERMGTALLPNKAKEAADFIATETFESEPFENGINEVIAGVSDRFVAHLTTYTQEMASSLGACFTEFLSTNYPPIIQAAAGSFIHDINPDVKTPKAPGAIVDPKAFATVVGGVVIGVVATLRRQLVRRIAGRIAGRVLGRVAAYAIPYAGWALAAAEIAFSWNGTIPEIVDSMSEPQAIAELQSELAMEFEFAVAASIPSIANDVVDGSLASWHRFVEVNETVLSIAATNPRFDNYLRQFDREEDFAPIRAAVVLIVELGGEAQLVEMIDKGQIAKVLRLRPTAYQIARDLDDIPAAIEWQEAAGAGVDLVQRSGLHKFKPYVSEISQSNLNFLLENAEKDDFRAIASLDEEMLTSLRSIDPLALDQLMAAHRTLDIGLIASALLDIRDFDAKNRMWRYVTSDRFDANDFTENAVMIASSKNQDLAARIVFARKIEMLNPKFFFDYASAIAQGDISPKLILSQAPLITFALALIAALLLRFSYAFFWPRKTRRKK